jgi:hypothetical protein
MIKVCTQIEIIHSFDVVSQTDTEITAAFSEALQKFRSFGLSSFEESQQTANGNYFVAQTLKFNTKQDIVSFLRLGNPSLMVLKLTFEDGTVYIYGDSDNPVAVTYSRSKGVTTITATRQTPVSEL